RAARGAGPGAGGARQRSGRERRGDAAVAVRAGERGGAAGGGAPVAGGGGEAPEIRGDLGEEVGEGPEAEETRTEVRPEPEIDAAAEATVGPVIDARTEAAVEPLAAARTEATVESRAAARTEATAAQVAGGMSRSAAAAPSEKLALRP